MKTPEGVEYEWLDYKSLDFIDLEKMYQLFWVGHRPIPQARHPELPVKHGLVWDNGKVLCEKKL